MKKLTETLICTTLIFAFALTVFGCDANDTSSESSSHISEDISEQMVSLMGILYNIEGWKDAEEIPVHMYLAWYRDYVNSITSAEERMERYTLEKYPNGFVYPQEEFEAYVQKYFNVSTEYLRSGDSYKSEDGVYHIEGGGSNIKYRTRMADTDAIETEGDTSYIRVELSLTGDFSDTEYRILKIQKEADGFKYLQCDAVSDK